MKEQDMLPIKGSLVLSPLLTQEQNTEKFNEWLLQTYKKYIPQPGDVFEWCDEEFICLTSSSTVGTVRQEGDSITQKFYWNFDSEPQIFKRKIKDGN